MPWRTGIEPRHNVLEVVYSGHVTLDEVRACAAAAGEAMQRSGISAVLVDLTAVTRFDAGTVDVVGFPELLRGAGVEPTYLEAIVAPHGSPAFETAAFYETVAVNRGRRVRLFPDRKRALAWLAAPG